MDKALARGSDSHPCHYEFTTAQSLGHRPTPTGDGPRAFRFPDQGAFPANATPRQRENWRRVGRGLGIHWPDVDEDVHVAHLLGLSD
ncbi:MAG TPA: DUF2442 domain-containing protein [Chloroflexota bacterium]|nr:DUF2442 domain-containing protein [Chloroflexota bacterium]